MSLSKKCRFPECCLVRAAGIIETLLSRCWRRWAPQLIWTLVPCEAPILALLQLRWGFLGSTSHKEHTCQCRRHKRREFNPWIGKIPWRKAWQPTLVFLPGESNGQRSLAGYSPWVTKSQTCLNDWAHTHAWSLDMRHWQGWQSPALINNAVMNAPHCIYPLDLGWILCKDRYSIGITWAEVCALKGGWRDFFGGPVAKTPCSQCRGPGFHP